MKFKELLNYIGIRHVEDEEYPSIDDPEFREKAKIRWMTSQDEIPTPSGHFK